MDIAYFLLEDQYQSGVLPSSSQEHFQTTSATVLDSDSLNTLEVSQNQVFRIIQIAVD